MTQLANLELAVALPLNVVANQLLRIEAELRFLSMKTSAYANERDTGSLASKVSGGLEKINEALDLIRALVVDMEASIQPPPASPSLQSNGARAARKPMVDRDD